MKLKLQNTMLALFALYANTTQGEANCTPNDSVRFLEQEMQEFPHWAREQLADLIDYHQQKVVQHLEDGSDSHVVTEAFEAGIRMFQNAKTIYQDYLVHEGHYIAEALKYIDRIQDSDKSELEAVSADATNFINVNIFRPEAHDEMSELINGSYRVAKLTELIQSKFGTDGAKQAELLSLPDWAQERLNSVPQMYIATPDDYLRYVPRSPEEEVVFLAEKSEYERNRILNYLSREHAYVRRILDDIKGMMINRDLRQVQDLHLTSFRALREYVLRPEAFAELQALMDLAYDTAKLAHLIRDKYVVHATGTTGVSE